MPVAAWLTPPVRPSAVSAAALLEEMLSVPLAVPVCSTMAPPATDEAVPVLPEAVSIAVSRLATVPMVEIWLAPAVPVTKVSVLPSTVSVSPAEKAEDNAPPPLAAVPDRSVVETSAVVVTAPPPRAWVMPEPRPRSVSTVAVPEIVRLAAVPVCSTSLPPLTEEPVPPVMASISLRRFATVAVEPEPMPMVKPVERRTRGRRAGGR